MNLVRAEGPKDADIVLVGEAPGTTDERTGRPFTGSAGLELNNCLANSGINRLSCYITNVIKERPPNNKIETFINLDKKYPEPTPEYKEYEEILYSELSSLNPNVIVAVGNVSLYALTRKKGITKYRGSILKGVDAINGKKVIPIIHPASALRMYIYRHFITKDLIRVRKESMFPAIKYMVRDFKLKPSYDESLAYLMSLKNVASVAYDIEVENDEVSCISFSTTPTEAICIPFKHKGCHYFNEAEEANIWLAIGRILENPSIAKIGQNIIFDSSFLFNKYGIITTNMEDTMIAMGVAYADFPKGLDFITSVYCDGEPYYKDDGKYRIKGGGGDDESFWIYNCKDSVVVSQAYPKILKDLNKVGNLDTYKAQRSLIEPLTYMQERGVKIDVERLEKGKIENKETVDILMEEFRELCGRDVNPASPKQLIEYFYIEKGIKPYISRTSGKPTVDADALKRLSRRGYKEATTLLKLRKLTKLGSTYLDVNLDNGRLKCAYNPVGTVSGRLSSSKNIFGMGMNMQNLPKEFRKYIIPDDGYCMYHIDLSQAENRIVAYIAPERRMIEAFESGADVHSLTASFIFNKDPNDILDIDGSSDIGNGEHSERFWGKKANHAFNYGQGYVKFAFICEIPQNQGKMIYNKYHQGYPGVRRYHEWVRHKLRDNLTLTNLFGRRKLFMDRWGTDLFNEAYSFIPQSTVADIINRHGLIPIFNDQDKFKYVELLMQVHDSIVLQIPIHIGLAEHAKILYSIKTMLEEPLVWGAREFIIPAGLEVCEGNLKDIRKVKYNSISELELQLKTIFKEDKYHENN